MMRSRRVTRRGVMLEGKEWEEGVGMSGAEGSSSIVGAIFTFFFYLFLCSPHELFRLIVFFFSFFFFSRANLSCFSFRQAFYSSGFPRLFWAGSFLLESQQFQASEAVGVGEGMCLSDRSQLRGYFPPLSLPYLLHIRTI